MVDFPYQCLITKGYDAFFATIGLRKCLKYVNTCVNYVCPENGGKSRGRAHCPTAKHRGHGATVTYKMKKREKAWTYLDVTFSKTFLGPRPSPNTE